MREVYCQTGGNTLSFILPHKPGGALGDNAAVESFGLIVEKEGAGNESIYLWGNCHEGVEYAGGTSFVEANKMSERQEIGTAWMERAGVCIAFDEVGRETAIERKIRSIDVDSCIEKIVGGSKD